MEHKLSRAHVEHIRDALTEQTGDAWGSTQTYDWSATLTRPRDGFTVGIHIDTYGSTAGRLNLAYAGLNGEGLNHLRFNEPRPGITVSGLKAADRVARDIVRRLLPDAETVHALVIERTERANDADARQAALKERVLETLGAGAHGTDHSPERVYPPTRFDGYGYVSVNTDTIRFELGAVPAAVALDMLAAMEKHYRKAAV